MSQEISTHDRAVAARRLTEVSTPVPVSLALELSGELLRADEAVKGLQVVSWRSNHAFMTLTALDHVIKVMREPQGSYAGIYRYNARQNLDSLSARLEDPSLNDRKFDQDHRANFLELLRELRRAINGLSEGKAEVAKDGLSASVNAALRIGANETGSPSDSIPQA